MDSIQSGWSDLGLRAWVNEGDDRPIRLGEPITYHFEADQECFLTVVYIDAHGVATLLSPSEYASEYRLEPGEVRAFPSADDGFGLEANPPVGGEVIFVIATRTPLSLSDLGLRNLVDGFSVSEAADAPALMERIKSKLASMSPESVAITKLEQRILGRGGVVQFTKTDVIAFFTTRTRAIQRPKLGSQYVGFDFDSAELTPPAKQNLDQFGEAFSDPSLEDKRFVIGGHTDDLGSEDYNQDLSERRAEATRSYLVQQHGLDPDRFEVRAYGESEPLDPGESDDARSFNRRVGFELIR